MHFRVEVSGKFAFHGLWIDTLSVAAILPLLPTSICVYLFLHPCGLMSHSQLRDFLVPYLALCFDAISVLMEVDLDLRRLAA